MGLLGILDLAVIATRLVGHILRTEALGGLSPSGVDGLARQRRRVGSHIGDPALFVETLGGAHGCLGAHPELATGLLLEGRGHEGGLGLGREGLGRHRGDLRSGSSQGTGEHSCLLGRQDSDRSLARRNPLRVVILSLGKLDAADSDHLGLESLSLGIELRHHVMPGRGPEGHALALALDDKPRRHRLDPASGESREHLLPQHRRDLVANQSVKDPASLLGVDESPVKVTGLFHCPLDGRAGDLVEDHALHRDGRVEDLKQVPGDGFALTVFIGGQIDLVHLLEQCLELGDHLLLAGGDHIERLEAVVHIDRQPCP